jgi:thiamine monophosphate kinase
LTSDLDPVAAALAGGEDYVLLFTLPAAVEPPPRFACRPVGTIARPRDVVLLDRDSRRLPLPALGWDHLERH